MAEAHQHVGSEQFVDNRLDVIDPYLPADGDGIGGGSLSGEEALGRCVHPGHPGEDRPRQPTKLLHLLQIQIGRRTAQGGGHHRQELIGRQP